MQISKTIFSRVLILEVKHIIKKKGHRFFVVDEFPLPFSLLPFPPLFLYLSTSICRPYVSLTHSVFKLNHIMKLIQARELNGLNRQFKARKRIFTNVLMMDYFKYKSYILMVKCICVIFTKYTTHPNQLLCRCISCIQICLETNLDEAYTHKYKKKTYVKHT